MIQSVEGRWGWEVPGWETSRHKRLVRAWPPMGRRVANGALDILCGFSCLSLSLWLEGLLCGLFPLPPQVCSGSRPLSLPLADPGGFSVAYSVGLEWLAGGGGGSWAIFRHLQSLHWSWSRKLCCVQGFGRYFWTMTELLSWMK